MKNFISFDLECWYDSEFIDGENKKDFVLEGLNNVLSILNKHKVKATFFVTGKILEKYPKTIKKLYKDGHEIASHGYEHIMVNKMKKEEFETAVKKSKKLIRKITGENPKGFRAPCWSISKKEFWAYNLLEKLGFKYSSSLFPINMGLYGSSNFPIHPFKPYKNLVEFPIRPLEVRRIRIPFAGGIYFRLLPRWMIKLFMKRLNKKNERIILYLHPWEFCENLPRVKTSLIGKIITYWGLKKNKSKLDYILSNFKFTPIKEDLKVNW